MSVRVQREDFDLGAEVAALTAGRPGIGAVVTFSGLVRDTVCDTACDTGGLEDRAGLDSLELEHYPGMTEKALAAIEAEAAARWELQASLVIHRYGRLLPGEQIMMVATAARHRQAAFEAAEFLMDYLKSRAPFWKKESGAGRSRWVDARECDEAALGRWGKPAGSHGSTKRLNEPAG